MSRFSRWYFGARKRIEQKERAHAGLKRAKAIEADKQKKLAERRASLWADIDKSIRDVGVKNTDVPPWERP